MGGLTLTLIIASVGIAGALPLGILLALGRRSRMPVVRTLSIIFIEFWRGVPLIYRAIYVIRDAAAVYV